MDKSKIIKMVILLAAITVIFGSLLRLVQYNSFSLADNERLNASRESKQEEAQTNASDVSVQEDEQSDASDDSVQEDTQSDTSDSPVQENMQGENQDSELSKSIVDSTGLTGTENTENTENTNQIVVPVTNLTGAKLNGTDLLEDRITYTEGFYSEPLSDSLRRFITGVSYPATTEGDSESPIEIGFEELRYLHIWHYNFEGNPAEGELICNESIANDLLEIFYELYRNEYQIESVLLIDEFDGDDTASMEANNTSCFNYRKVEGSENLSKHAYGLAIDINPFYNPYVTYPNGVETISPAGSEAYADRSVSFPYKIDQDDLCYKLFTEHGFTWGGNWNNIKDYQHFQKVKP